MVCSQQPWAFRARPPHCGIHFFFFFKHRQDYLVVCVGIYIFSFFFFLFLLQVKFCQVRMSLGTVKSEHSFYNVELLLCGSMTTISNQYFAVACYVIGMCLLVHNFHTLLAVSEHTTVRITDRMVLITWDTTYDYVPAKILMFEGPK